MKKQSRPRSPPKKRKARGAPLPLDTSRSRRTATAHATPAKHKATPTRPTPGRGSRQVSTLSTVWHRITTASRSDRTDAAMLALPLILVVFTIAVGRWSHTVHHPQTVNITPGAKRALVGLPPVATPVTPLWPSLAAATSPPPAETVTEAASPSPPAVAAADPTHDPVLAAAPTGSALTSVSPSAATLAEAPADPDAVSASEGVPGTPAPSLFDGPRSAIAAAKPTPSAVPMAALNATPIVPGDPDGIAIPAWDLPGGTQALATGLSQCRYEREPPRRALAATWTPGDGESFGLALATAARSQIEEFVIYNDRYTRLKYPMGDVHPMYGVCTDVIIRAYRELGIDLQELVQKTKSGSGDPNIDHRRVDTLRKFFSRFGESLPISSFAEDYRPGDIVTYWRPQNRHSRTHIAVVSDRMSPSGRPFIIHNRGWGPQQEDGLFVDQITGHYRFSGLKTPPDSVREDPRPKGRSLPEAARSGRPVVKAGLRPSKDAP